MRFKYISYIKSAFESPELNNEKGKFNIRQASPLELFFDLVFVILLANIGHLFYDLSIENIILTIALYVSIYAVWSDMNMYFMRFFNASYRVRFGLVLIMMPLLWLAGINDFHTQQSIELVVLAFFFSKMALMIVWYTTVFKNNKVDNQIFKKTVKIELQGLLISSLIILIVFVYPTILFLSLMLILSLLFEVLYINLMYKRYFKELIADENKKTSNKNNTIESVLLSKHMPQIDYELLKERHVLFLILVFGEGVVSSVKIFNIDITAIFSLLDMFFMFAIVVFFFFRVYEEFIIMEYNDHIKKTITFNHMTFAMVILILFSLLGAITVEQNILFISYRILISLLLIYNCIWHLVKNIKPKTRNLSKSENYFRKLDNKILIVMVFLAVSLIFITKVTTFLLVVMIYFFIHLIPIVYRYANFKNKINQNNNIQI